MTRDLNLSRNLMLLAQRLDDTPATGKASRTMGDAAHALRTVAGALDEAHTEIDELRQRIVTVDLDGRTIRYDKVAECEASLAAIQERLAVAEECVRMREVKRCCPTDDGWWLRVGMDFAEWPRVRQMTEAEQALIADLRRETCPACWGSHGCDLPAGHPGPWHACCVSDDPSTFDPDDPHNSACLAWALDDPLSYECAKS